MTMLFFGCSRNVDIPDVKGMNIEVAKEELKKVSKNFTIIEENTHEKYSSYKVGDVIDEKIVKNDGKSNANIKLLICDAEYKPIPEVWGESIESTINKLNKIGLKVSKEYKYEFSYEITEGLCIRTTPYHYFDGKGIENEEIVLTISKGIDDRVLVPNVKFLSETEAIRKLENAGVKWKIKYIYNDIQAYDICASNEVKDKVISQSFEGRTELHNPVVELTVNRQSIVLNNFPKNSYGLGYYSSYCTWHNSALRQNFYFTNRSDKTIKYIEFYIYFKNRVKDEILKNGVLTSMQSNYTGPLCAGQSDYGIWDSYLVSSEAYFWYL